MITKSSVFQDNVAGLCNANEDPILVNSIEIMEEIAAAKSKTVNVQIITIRMNK